MTVGDICGQIIGWLSLVSLALLWSHCDALSDGNVGGEDR